MSKIGQYLLSVVAAAVIVAISNSFLENKGAIGSILKLITGLALAMVIVSPWTDLRLKDLEYFYSYAEADASSLVLQGQQTAQSEVFTYIKTQIQAYILDKASTLDLNISADVKLTEGSTPSIARIIISGAASPYAKQRLTQMLREDLGVTEECLLWT